MTPGPRSRRHKQSPRGQALCQVYHQQHLDYASILVERIVWGTSLAPHQSQKGAITAPERHHLPNCKQASLLTKTSWDSGRSTSPEGSQPEISSPEETHNTSEKVCMLGHLDFL